MSFQCPICIDTICDSNSNPAAALSCGHVFHANCILHWMESTSNARSCPNCKVTIQKRKMISRLYFSSQPESIENDPSFDSAQSAVLQAEIVTLKQQNTVMKDQLRVSDLRVKSLQDQVADALLGKRYLKQIQSVAELDDDVSSPRSQKYLQELEKIPHRELKVQAAALRARQLKAATERDDIQKRMEKIQRQNDTLYQKNLHLSNKVDRLQAKLKSDTPNPIQSNSVPEQESAILLDTDSEDEQDTVQNISGPSNPTLAYQHIDLDDNSDDEVQFLVQNYTLSNLKRRNMINNNNFDGKKRSRT